MFDRRVLADPADEDRVFTGTLHWRDVATVFADIDDFMPRGGWLSLLAALAGVGFMAVPTIQAVRHR